MKFVSEINLTKKWALRTKVQNKKAEYFAYYLVNALHNIDTQHHHRTFIPATQIITKEPPVQITVQTRIKSQVILTIQCSEIVWPKQQRTVASY